MYPHLVYILPITESTDLTASLVETPPSTEGLTPVACWINLKETRAGMQGDAEIGTTEANVYFPVNPGSIKGCFFQRTTDGLSLRALGRAKDVSFGFNFCVACVVIE